MKRLKSKEIIKKREEKINEGNKRKKIKLRKKGKKNYKSGWNFLETNKNVNRSDTFTLKNVNLVDAFKKIKLWTFFRVDAFNNKSGRAIDVVKVKKCNPLAVKSIQSWK